MIRLGIVGCGRILAAHLRGYRLLRAAGVDTFRITALCSPRTDDARMYVARGGPLPQRPPASDLTGDPLSIGDEYLSDFQPEIKVAIYRDFREMIAEGPIDAVNDFSTHALHHQVAQAAFAHGKDLLTQKPLAVTVAAARRMCAAAQAQGLVLGVFENFRFLPASRHLAWLFGSGLVGRPQMVLFGYVGAWWAPDRIVAHTPWRHLRSEGGGISLDLGVHFFDQVRQVAGEVQSIAAQTAVLEPRRCRRDDHGRVVAEIDCDADDTCMAQFVTSSGTIGTLVASWAGRGPQTLLGEGSVFYGSQGRATHDDVWLADGRRLPLRECYAAQAEPTLCRQHFPLGLSDSFALAQLDWLEAVGQRRSPEMSGREGLADLAAAYAILESAHAGRRVSVAEVAEGRLADFQRPLDERFGLLPNRS